ncbi:MAG: sporulation protein YunB [Ruminococcus sp.]|nr:sporulation protein YunB [Ruminococcus sp.]
MILFVTGAVLWHKAEKAIGPVAEMQAEKYAKRSSNEIISSVVSEYLDETRYTYSDFSAVMHDEAGRVVSVEAVPYNINKAQSELALRVNHDLKEAMEGTMEIPVGTLTGKYLFAGKGPRLKLKLCPAGEAEVSLKSTFESAGINQTSHSITAVINVEISSSMPMYSFVTEVSFEYLIAESIIVGEVPEVSRYAWKSI